METQTQYLKYGDVTVSTTNIMNLIFVIENSNSGGCRTLETPNLFLNLSIVSLVNILIWSCFIIKKIFSKSNSSFLI